MLGPTPRLPAREWLARAPFALVAIVTRGVVVLSSLGLLNATEAISAMLPVSTLTAVIIGSPPGASNGPGSVVTPVGCRA